MISKSDAQQFWFAGTTGRAVEIFLVGGRKPIHKDAGCELLPLLRFRVKELESGRLFRCRDNGTLRQPEAAQLAPRIRNRGDLSIPQIDNLQLVLSFDSRVSACCRGGVWRRCGEQ